MKRQQEILSKLRMIAETAHVHGAVGGPIGAIAEAVVELFENLQKNRQYEFSDLPLPTWTCCSNCALVLSDDDLELPHDVQSVQDRALAAGWKGAIPSEFLCPRCANGDDATRTLQRDVNRRAPGHYGNQAADQIPAIALKHTRALANR